MSVVKFPYDACRRIHSRRPRISKNGTPKERAAKAADAAAKSTAAAVIEISPRRVSKDEAALRQQALSNQELREKIDSLDDAAKQFMFG